MPEHAAVESRVIMVLTLIGEPAMTLQGTVVNGVIVLTGNPQLPEGAIVGVELADTEDWAGLQEANEHQLAGSTRPAHEVLNDIARRHNFSLEPGS